MAHGRAVQSSRVDVAFEQLEAAIRLFRDTKSYASVITLPSAAAPVMGPALLHAGKEAGLDWSFMEAAPVYFLMPSEGWSPDNILPVIVYQPRGCGEPVAVPTYELAIEKLKNDVQVPEGKLGEADKQPFLTSLGWSRGASWSDLPQSRRVPLISEAGAGKTFECRTQAHRLSAAGEAAFFVELAGLAKDELRALLEDEEEARLDAWLSSQSEVATFFLDSIDELQLSLGSFDPEVCRSQAGMTAR